MKYITVLLCFMALTGCGSDSSGGDSSANTQNADELSPVNLQAEQPPSGTLPKELTPPQ